MSLNPSLIRRKQDASIRQAANLARISMPTAKQKHSAPAPSCPATMRTEAMKGEGGDYLISLRKEGSHRSRSIVRVALIAPGVRCNPGIVALLILVSPRFLFYGGSYSAGPGELSIPVCA